MRMEKVYADAQGRTTFLCPHCSFKIDFDASAYRDRDSRIRIKCRCGKSTPVLIEFRKFYRREVSLTGSCRVHRTGAVLGIRVHDLSMSGLSFSIEFKDDSKSKSDGPELVVGDVVSVQFHLDNQARTLVQRRAEVRNLRPGRCGVGFFKTEYDKDLGFYLLS
jgi:hypothetical protein